MRTCSYDRAGFGWSDPPPTRSVAGYVEDLHELLRRAGEKPPCEGSLPDLEVVMSPEQRRIHVPLTIISAKWRADRSATNRCA